MTTGTRLGTVTRVAGADVYVELYDVAAGFEFGPCIDAVGGLAKGDQIVAQPLARDEHELVIIGRVGGALGSYIVPLERLPVAPSGNANPTQIVRADDARLSDARTPTAHTHDDRYYTQAQADARRKNPMASSQGLTNNLALTSATWTPVATWVNTLNPDPTVIEYAGNQWIARQAGIYQVMATLQITGGNATTAHLKAARLVVSGTVVDWSYEYAINGYFTAKLAWVGQVPVNGGIQPQAYTSDAANSAVVYAAESNCSIVKVRDL